MIKIIYDAKNEDSVKTAYEAVRVLTANGFYGLENNTFVLTNKIKWDKEQDVKLKKITKG